MPPAPLEPPSGPSEQVTSTLPSTAGFGERLAAQVEERRSQLVLGLDPDPLRLWPQAIELAGGEGHPSSPPSERAARAVSAHCRLVLEATAEHCAAVKLQLACFERLGAPGWQALQEVAEDARARGLLIIADGKRGDIDVSAAAYAAALMGETPTPFGSVPGLGADAATVNPLLGADALMPFVNAARERGAGLFVLVRTSNPGAAELQDEELVRGGTLSERIARLVTGLGGSAGDVGAVVAATAPHQLQHLRGLMPGAPFLLPGVGAQGGQVERLGAAFIPGRAGGLVTVSRGIVAAHESAGGTPGQAAASQAEALRRSIWDVSESLAATSS